MIIKEVERVAKDLRSHTHTRENSQLQWFYSWSSLNLQSTDGKGSRAISIFATHRVWSTDQQHQHHLGGCESSSISGPTSDLLNLHSFISPGELEGGFLELLHWLESDGGSPAMAGTAYPRAWSQGVGRPEFPSGSPGGKCASKLTLDVARIWPLRLGDWGPRPLPDLTGTALLGASHIPCWVAP